MLFLIHLYILTCVLTLEQDTYDYVSTGLVVANIRRRESIPLQSSKWVLSNNLNYRRTKDIRQDLSDRRFEITEGQLREAQREAQLRNSQRNEMREDVIKSQLREDYIRNEVQARDKALRDYEMRENQLGVNTYNQRNKNNDDKNLNNLQREVRWVELENRSEGDRSAAEI